MQYDHKTLSKVYDFYLKMTHSTDDIVISAVGEPPITLSVGALFANKLAVNSARHDLFNSKEFMATGLSIYFVFKIRFIFFFFTQTLDIIMNIKFKVGD